MSFTSPNNVSFQIQADKEKLLCEIDEMHAQLEKAQYNTNRFQAEKEDFQLDSERHRSTNEKLQVSFFFGYKLDFLYSKLSRKLNKTIPMVLLLTFQIRIF